MIGCPRVRMGHKLCEGSCLCMLIHVLSLPWPVRSKLTSELNLLYGTYMYQPSSRFIGVHHPLAKCSGRRDGVPDSPCSRSSRVQAVGIQVYMLEMLWLMPFGSRFVTRSPASTIIEGGYLTVSHSEAESCIPHTATCIEVRRDIWLTNTS